MRYTFDTNNMGIGVAGNFKAQDYTDAGYTGVSLSGFNGSIPAGKQVVGQYTIPSWRGGRGGGGKQFFVVADAPQPKQQQAAPAPSGGGGGGGPDYASQIQALNEQAQTYRTQAEQIIAQGEAKVKELENADLQRQKAAELQNRLAIQAQTSQARGQAAPNLRIAQASQPPQTAGTQAFKRRDKMSLAPIQSTAGINVPSGSVLNI